MMLCISSAFYVMIFNVPLEEKVVVGAEISFNIL